MAKVYDPHQPLLSIHIPKCGGQSFLSVLENWFGNECIHRHYRNPDSSQLPHPIENFESNRPHVIHGHFNRKQKFGLNDYYPQANQFLTFVRDPLQMQISLFHYRLKRFNKNENLPSSYNPKEDLNTYLMRAKPFMLNYFHAGLTIDNFKEYLETKFIFLGVVEYFQDSLNCLSRILRKEELPSPKINQGNYKLDVSDKTISEFKQRCTLEYAIYEYAVNRVKTQMNK